MNWQNFWCAIGIHDEGYKYEKTPFIERGQQKTKVSLIRVCKNCPNGRKIIVDRSLLLGD